MKYLILLVLCLYTAAIAAQQAPSVDCDSEALMKQPGKWLPSAGDEVDTGTLRPTPADAAATRKLFGRISTFFREKYVPIGADVYDYLTHHISSGTISNGYIYTLSNFRWICVNGKKTKNSEAVSSAIHVNPDGALGVWFREMPIYNERGVVSPEAAGSLGFYALTPRECPNGKLPDSSKGHFIVQGINESYVWITYPGKLPYRYVTRKEFLEKQIALLEAQRKERKPGDPQEFLSTFFEKPLEAYRNDLKKDTAWLNAIAIVKPEVIKDFSSTRYLYSRYGFTTLTDPVMSVPILPNPAYYNRNLPKSSPQLMIIRTGRTDNFIGQNFRKIVEENLGFFKSLLGS